MGLLGGIFVGLLAGNAAAAGFPSHMVFQASIAVGQSGAQLPTHRIFTLLFVPTAFVIVATASFALGVGLRKPRLGLSLGR